MSTPKGKQMVKKRKLMIMPQKTFESNLSFQMFINDEKLWMYDRIYESIEEAFRSGNKIAHVLEAKIEDTMSIVSINSDVSEWVSSLNLAIDWYIAEELYEKCAKVRDLIKEIESTELK